MADWTRRRGPRVVPALPRQLAGARNRVHDVNGHRAPGRLHASPRAVSRSRTRRRRRSRRGFDADGADRPLRLRIHRAVGTPGRRRVARNRRTRCRVAVVVCAGARRGPHDAGDVHGARGRDRGVPPHVASVPRRRRTARTADAGARGNARVVGAMERSVHVRRRVARRSAAVPDRAQSPDLRAHRRHRRRRNHLSARTAWRGPQLGLPFLLAARRDVHALLAPRLRVHGRGDFVAWLAAARGCRRSSTKCRPCTVRAASGV